MRSASLRVPQIEALVVARLSPANARRLIGFVPDWLAMELPEEDGSRREAIEAELLALWGGSTSDQAEVWSFFHALAAVLDGAEVRVPPDPVLRMSWIELEVCLALDAPVRRAHLVRAMQLADDRAADAERAREDL